jgi:hypothetical protein
MIDRTNNPPPALRPTLSPSADTVMSALRGAADRTGADFGYLLSTAMRESSLNPEAKAATSSATGLFQFIEQTWLGTMHRHGAAHGLSAYADAIKTGKDGRFMVTDKGTRQEILALRKDPQVAALMAGELTNDMSSEMGVALGRGVSAGELYVAHFLGPQAAVKMIKAAADTPTAAAANLFPDAAAANTRIFYNKGGEARSVVSVLEGLKAKHEGLGDAVQYAVAAKSETLSGSAGSTHLRGAVGDAQSLTYPTAGNVTDRFGMDAMVMSPMMVQLLSSVDPLPSLAKVFSPDDDLDPRTSKL